MYKIGCAALRLNRDAQEDRERVQRDHSMPGVLPYRLDEVKSHFQAAVDGA